MPGKAPKISQSTHGKQRVPGKTRKVAAGAHRKKIVSDKASEYVPVVYHRGILSQVFSSIDKDHEPDSMQVITLIREGVSGDSIIRLADLINIPKNDVYNLLNLKARTAQRQVSKNLDADKSGHLVQITRILQRCVEVFEDLGNAQPGLAGHAGNGAEPAVEAVHFPFVKKFVGQKRHPVGIADHHHVLRKLLRGEVQVINPAVHHGKSSGENDFFIDLRALHQATFISQLAWSQGTWTLLPQAVHSQPYSCAGG
jgi:hypothetical protein